MPREIDRVRMTGRTATYLIVAFLLGPLLNHALARGRSFPIEVTGTANGIDKAGQTVTLRADQPARILTINQRWDCKFKNNGAQAGPEILKEGAYLRVSYFATIFTGNLAVEIEANPKPEVVQGVIERIELAGRQMTLRLNSSRRFLIRWAANARFFSRGKTIAPAALKEGAAVKVSYYSPAFANKYAVRIELQ